MSDNIPIYTFSEEECETIETTLPVTDEEFSDTQSEVSTFTFSTKDPNSQSTSHSFVPATRVGKGAGVLNNFNIFKI